MVNALDFARVFEQLPNPIMVVDREFRCVAANSAFLELTRANNALVGRSVFEAAVVLDFAGDISGPIVWVFPVTLALELVRRLMADPNPSIELAIDGANILTGRASEVFEHFGVHCEFGVPRIHEGALPVGTIVQLSTDAGSIDLMLAMLASHPAR